MPQNEITKKLNRAVRYLQDTLPTKIGVESVKFFKKSFIDQGFTDKTLTKWEDVKRRDPKSEWYGFQYGATSTLPSNHPRNSANKKKAKKKGTTNYSPAAAKRSVLTSQNKTLFNSIEWKKTSKGVEISANTPYASVHNEGLNSKIFGKKSFKMIKRQFIGPSDTLKKQLMEMLKNDLKDILR